MQGEQAGLEGAIPQLQIKPVDPTLPTCGKDTPQGACTRKQGHYGLCGVAQ